VKETEEVSDKIKDIDKELHPTEQAVRGRGKYKDKIVVRKKQPSIVDMAKITSKKAINVIHSHGTLGKVLTFAGLATGAFLH
jgi:hypothetical protein